MWPQGCFVCRRVLPRLCFRGPERLASVAADVSLDPISLGKDNLRLAGAGASTRQVDLRSATVVRPALDDHLFALRADNRGRKLNIEGTGRGRVQRVPRRAGTAPQNVECVVAVFDGEVRARKRQVLVANVGHRCRLRLARTVRRLVPESKSRTIAIQEDEAVAVSIANVGNDEALRTGGADERTRSHKRSPGKAEQVAVSGCGHHGDGVGVAIENIEVLGSIEGKPGGICYARNAHNTGIASVGRNFHQLASGGQVSSIANPQVRCVRTDCQTQPYRRPSKEWV